MRISQKNKYLLYENLSSLIHGGTTLTEAVGILRQRSSNPQTRSLLGIVAEQLKNGAAAADAFRDAGMSDLDYRTVAAADTSGNLDTGFRQLAEYYRANAELKSSIIGNLLYPAFILHFGILLLGLPEMLAGKGWNHYLVNSLGLLLLIYLCLLAIYLAARLLATSAKSSPLVEKFLHSIPLAGPMTADFSRSRFCHLLSLQLDSGINLIDSLLSASESSGSAGLRKSCRRAAQTIREGARISEILQNARVFPAEMMDALTVAEKTGTVEPTLLRWAVEFRKNAIRRAEKLAFWIPKIIYIIILLYLGWKIISIYQESLHKVMSVME